MLDIEFVRKNQGVIRKDLEKRVDSEATALLNELIEKDVLWRKLKGEADSLRGRRNTLSREINEAKKAGKDTALLLEEAKQVPAKIADLDKQTTELSERTHKLLLLLPNVLHESVPVGKDDSENVVVKKWGKAAKPKFEVKHHGQLAADLNLADFERAVKISGSGFFFLKGELALLDIALQRFAIDKLVKQGFTLVQPPLLMRRKPYEGVAPLEDFENVMYKTENTDLYLIATSEHPLTSMHMNEIFEECHLPIKMAGVSPCFRREIGKHGLDERGFFRVHQFNKIEQIILCKPEDSYKWIEVLRKNAEQLLTDLKIPWNTTNVCTGDMGIVAAKKYDINGWSPREQKYIELMSCSNCTDYQSAGLNMKYQSKQGEKKYIHTLNSTMVATTRTLRVILENYQTKEGSLKIPNALQKYMNGIKEISPKKKKAPKGKSKNPTGKKTLVKKKRALVRKKTKKK
ncbi:MAG: serine--tRNA ligase [Candidatus Diapherotrites archaeon]|nr:serine--tRNA ligase [Candidatus Diapherotrites archaeon]